MGTRERDRAGIAHLLGGYVVIDLVNGIHHVPHTTYVVDHGTVVRRDLYPHRSDSHTVYRGPAARALADQLQQQADQFRQSRIQKVSR